MEHLATIIVAGQIAAALAIFGGMLTGLGQGRIAAQAIESIARQPEARGSISTSMIIGLAMAETNGIYGFVISIILLFANPLVTRFVTLVGELGLS